MRDKNVAAILALVLGVFGVHRFYLGQKGLGILYFLFFWIGIPAILGFIDAILLFAMSQDEFDKKYNWKFMRDEYYRKQQYEQQRQQPYGAPVPKFSTVPPKQPTKPLDEKPKQSNTKAKAVELTYETTKSLAIRKFKEYDYQGAIIDFEKLIRYNPNDVAVHFNVACAYSLIENTEKGFYHIQQAVALGFNDFQKIKSHDALAFLRIQDEWDDFVANNYTLTIKETTEAPAPPPVADYSDLLEQIKHLDELRKSGKLSEAQFAEESRKLFKG